jgi:hypothetical protein
MLLAGLSANFTSTDTNWALLWKGGVIAYGLILQITPEFTATYNTMVSKSLVATFPHPLPIAAGTVLKVTSYSTATRADGWFIGWEE